MNNINIVPMTADHLDALEQLERTCFSRPWSRKMLAEELDNECAAFLVAEDAATGEAVGYAGLLVAADEGYITNVAVFPPYRRRGVAGKLLDVFLRFDLRGAAQQCRRHCPVYPVRLPGGRTPPELLRSAPGGRPDPDPDLWGG